MKLNRTIGGSLLVTGTCVGAGILALPVATSQTGFMLSLLLLTLGWSIFFLCGLYVMEVNLWFPEGTNFISMSRYTLGYTGETVTWLVYLLLLYSLIAAYLTGGSQILRHYLMLNMPNMTGSLIWVAVLGLVIWFGPRCVDYFNRLFLAGLLLGFGAIVFLVAPQVNKEQLLSTPQTDYLGLLVTLPVIASAFGFHIVLPTVRVYLRSGVDSLQRVVLYGSLIPLLVYVLWDVIMFGILPQFGDHSLTMIKNQGGDTSQIAHSISYFVHSPWVSRAVGLFSVTAMATSFVGVSTSLFDFIADGFNINKTRSGKMVLLVLTFGPPLIYVFFFPQGFILALSYAGVFVAILHCLLPALMFAIGRRYYQTQTISGNNMGIGLVVLFGVFIIVGQIAEVGFL